MDNNKIMQDVRKAHRLVFEYQKRMIQLVFLFKDKLSFAGRMEGKKHFSDAIGPIRNSYGNLSIFPNMWAWDFIYSYEMEYYFGERSCKDNNGNKVNCAISALQITDSGWFDSDAAQQCRTSEFYDADKSKSYLVIIFESSNDDGNWSKWEFNREFVKSVGISKKDFFGHNTENGHFLWY